MEFGDDGNNSGVYNDTVSVGGYNYPSQLPNQTVVLPEKNNMSSDSPIKVTIPDSMSEKDRVSFIVHTKSNLPNFKQREFSVQRSHEEFVWLHDQLEDNEAYAGVILPPVPPKPDFDASKAKLQRLGEGDGMMTKEDLQKMKIELEAEYLAMFRKTVAMHEVFLQRVASHPVLHTDYGFHVFLEYKEDLSVRNKNKKEKAASLLRSVTKTADENLILSNQRDEDSFFREEKSSLVAYNQAARETTACCDIATRQRRAVGEALLQVAYSLSSLSLTYEPRTPEATLLNSLQQFTEDLQKLEVLVGADEDLKLSDTIRYYAADSGAAKELLYRRARNLADYETANRNLDKARLRAAKISNQAGGGGASGAHTAAAEVAVAEQAQTAAYERFNLISEQARKELEDFKVRRINYFKKNLVDHAELQASHSKKRIDLLKSTLAALRTIPTPGGLVVTPKTTTVGDTGLPYIVARASNASTESHASVGGFHSNNDEVVIRTGAAVMPPVMTPVLNGTGIAP